MVYSLHNGSHAVLSTGLAFSLLAGGTVHASIACVAIHPLHVLLLHSSPYFRKAFVKQRLLMMLLLYSMCECQCCMGFMVDLMFAIFMCPWYRSALMSAREL